MDRVAHDCRRHVSCRSRVRADGPFLSVPEGQSLQFPPDVTERIAVSERVRLRRVVPACRG